MRNRDGWRPSKYVYKEGKLIASRDKDEASSGSRLMVNLVPEFYNKNLRQHAKGKLLDRRLWYWHSLKKTKLRKKISETKENFPFGYFLVTEKIK